MCEKCLIRIGRVIRRMRSGCRRIVNGILWEMSEHITQDLPILSTRVGTVERVSSFKLLGVYIESTLSWSLHIDNIVKKATQRLYFLK